MTNVVYLHGQPQSIAQFVRIGSSGHRQLEHVLAAGRLAAKRFVVDAGTFQKQSDLISALRQSERELVLDTNVAELSAVGRFKGMAQGAPWANPDGVLTPAHFKSGANEFDIIGKIARFAVTQGVRRVHAPAHLLDGVKDAWFSIDLSACTSLRRALDIEGGRDIAIDYPLMIPNAVLNDAAERKALLGALASLPINSLWFRISGFGAGATGAGLRKYVAAAQDFQILGKPIVADGVGGMAALAIAAFGAACGIAHGVAEKERFDTSKWNKPPTSGGGGGGYNILLPGIDRLLKRAEAEALMSVPHARRLLSCNDPTCCMHGFEDTLKDPKGHYLRQRASQLRILSSVPEQRRVRHFLDTDLAIADRTARQVAKLKVADPQLAKTLRENANRLDRMRDVLEDLHTTMAARASGPTPTNSLDSDASNRDRR